MFSRRERLKLFSFLHDSRQPVYTIKVAASLIGCHPRTLRIYEEAGLVCPKRTRSRYRMYSESDLVMIKKVCDLMDELSLNLSGVKALFKMCGSFHIEIEKMIDEMLK
jgi:MerR family transcriptional regulator/heat shock protein HspR